MTSTMSGDSLRILAERPTVQDESALGSIMDVALDQGLWLDLLPLAVHLRPAQLAVIATRVAEKPDDELAERAIACGRDRVGELLRDAWVPPAVVGLNGRVNDRDGTLRA
ncbi:hypothetical protein [Nocardia nepalensis]|uniref:hypothetical protein n=1 Tax=Nocardia nepalensis TaxID=3375448 RepID=UPI003B676B42